MVKGDYSRRHYRVMHQGMDLSYFQVKLKETDLAIGVERSSFNEGLIDLAEKEVIKLRADLEDYISLFPEFRTSFLPVPALPGAPSIAKVMIAAATRAGVGPMAAVAGAIAQAVGRNLERFTQEVIVENGGDIYLNGKTDRTIAVFAGDSPFSGRIGIQVKAGEMPLGICTSSGTVGPSTSLGQADAVVIKSQDAALADAIATGTGNLVRKNQELTIALDYARNIKGVTGVLLIRGQKLLAWGDVELVPVQKKEV